MDRASDLSDIAPSFASFDRVADPTVFAPLPDDWIVGLSDIVDSTEAIRTGGYKAVNLAGAAVIAAVSNALDQSAFPFVFGGDGASFAVPPGAAPAARDALARTATLVSEELGLELRIAEIPVSAIRAVGYDVRVARFAASPNVAYTMFAGGGLRWAETQMKAGRFGIPPAPAGARSDLSGLSCRFAEIPSQRGLVLSLIVRPTAKAGEAFRRLIIDLLARIEASPDMARPMPDGGPPIQWPSPGLALEAKLSAPPNRSRLLHRLGLLARTLATYGIFRLGLRAGRFDPSVYMSQLVANSDYRKYDDGLRMTIDCDPKLADTIEAMLASAATEGVVEYGTHRQSAALVTCITPSALRSDHIHFIDGASGGYAAAAAILKDRHPG